MAEMPADDARLASAWRAQELLDEALRAVTADATSYWLHRRLLFARAHAVRVLMCGDGAFADGGAIVYAVVVRNQGCVYIGETMSQRRLWDIPVGESHHLAATFPPSVWDRLVALRWSELDGVVAPADQASLRFAGRALERELHRRIRPEMNLWTKRSDGRWGRRSLAATLSLDGFDPAAAADVVAPELLRLLTTAVETPAVDVGAGRIVSPQLVDPTPYLDLATAAAAPDASD